MEGIESVLLLWISKASNRQNLKIQDLKDSKIFFSLVTELYKSYPIQMVQPSQKINPMQANFMNFKAIYQAIQSFYKNILVSSLPVGLPSVNMMEISKGEDKEGLVTLLIIFFIACINSEQKEKYITYIMDFDESQQAQLMNLIQDKALVALQVVEESTPAEIQLSQRGKIDEYLFKIQSLVSQNQSLTNQLISQGQQKNKLKQQIKKLQADNKKIRRQLDQKTLYIHQKQQQEQEQQSSKQTISQSNEQIIAALRKQFVEQQREHLEEKKKLQDKIQILGQQLASAQDQISELENQDLVGVTSNRKVHHQDCVSINQHKNVTQKLQIKLKSLEQKQTQLEREILRAKYEYDELNRKYKKEEKQKENLKVECEKASMNRGKLISQKQAEKIKLSIMEAIREKLKSKLEEQKNGKDK